MAELVAQTVVGVVIGVFWIGCGFLAYGLAKAARHDARWPGWDRGATVFDSWLVVAGPFGLVGTLLLTGFGRHGLMFRSPAPPATTPGVHITGMFSTVLQSPPPPPPLEPTAPLLTLDDLEEKDELRSGWRSYGMRFDPADGLILAGGAARDWPTDKLEADCGGDTERAVDHILNPRHAAEAHRQFACGIYSTRGPPSMGFPYGAELELLARCLSWGAVANAPSGYRAQFCRIEALYLITGDEPQAALVALEARYDFPIVWFTPEEWARLRGIEAQKVGGE